MQKMGRKFNSASNRENYNKMWQMGEAAWAKRKTQGRKEAHILPKKAWEVKALQAMTFCSP